MQSPRKVLRVFLSNRFLATTLFASLVVLAIVLVPIAFWVVNDDISLEFLSTPLAVTVIGLSTFYGLIRGGINHPVFDGRYSQWLSQTPWTANKPLPKGPIHPVMADLVVVVLFSLAVFVIALGFEPPIWPYVVGSASLFALSLALVWSLANYLTGEGRYVYAVLAVPIIFGLLQIESMGYFACSVLMAVIAWLGVRRSLRSFPWEDVDSKRQEVFGVKAKVTIAGWPYRQLLCPARDSRATWHAALLQGCLIGAWVWFIFSRGGIEDHNDEVAIRMMLGLSSTYPAIGKLILCGPAVCSSLCIGRRIANKQWFVWEHDQIFVAPLMIIAIGWFLPAALAAAGLSTPLACGIAAAAIYFVARALGPNIEELHHTGIHSMSGTLGSSKRREFETASGSKDQWSVR
jgi:hypothetical protein